MDRRFSRHFWISSHHVCVGSRRVHRSSGERGESLHVPWYLSNHDCSIYPPLPDIDIIGLLITGVLFIILFLVWQGCLEHIHTSLPPFGSSCEKVLSANSGPQRGATPVGEINRSWRTPPPLMKLSLWRRANGRLVAMMLIVFLTWGAMITWGFWAQVRFKASHTFGSQSSAFSSYLCNSCTTKTCAPLSTANIFPSPALVCIRDHLHRHRRHRHLSHADHPLHQSVYLFFLILQDI